MQNQVPLGFRFNPTDVELIIYLLMRVLGKPLPSTVIQELDVYRCTEEEIRGAIHRSDGEMFAFVRKRPARGKHDNQDRSAKGGSWKVKATKFFLDKTHLHIGCKRSLIFMPDHDHGGYENNLLMDEFEYAPKFREHENELTELVICRIKESKGNRSLEWIDRNSVKQYYTASGPSQLLSHLWKNYCSCEQDNSRQPFANQEVGESSNQGNMYLANMDLEQDMLPDNSYHANDQLPNGVSFEEYYWQNQHLFK